MAKSAILILASALSFMSFLGSAYGTAPQDRFYIEGSVYCDTCRVQFITKLTHLVEGAIVKLECRDFEGSDNITFSKEAVTDTLGAYTVEVDGDHEEEVCQVILVKSPEADCGEVDHESHVEQAAKINLTKNNGILSPIRKANPLGFLRKEPVPHCEDVLKELEL